MTATLVNLATGDAKPLEATNMIGRSSSSLIVLENQRVSRHHAMIRLHDDGFYFYDLGSFNGSQVNGARVTSNHKLENGDVIRIADYELRFEGSRKALDAPERSQLLTTTPLLQRNPVILLVSDVMAYTKLSEQLSSDELAQVIGSWYGSCEQVLDSRGATVDKYLGDAVLAYWPETNVQTRRSALIAAAELSEGCRRIHESQRAISEKPGLAFRSGISLHIGEVTRGPLGGGEFSLVGDAVNVAFRVEELTRPLECEVLVTAEFLSGWREGSANAVNRGRHHLKGRQEPVDVFSVESVRSS